MKFINSVLHIKIIALSSLQDRLKNVCKNSDRFKNFPYRKFKLKNIAYSNEMNDFNL